jgi:exopolysaccharide biosynthesis WecB/TagA/CpsF family protein
MTRFAGYAPARTPSARPVPDDAPRVFTLRTDFVPLRSGLVTFMNPYSWLVSRNARATLDEFAIYADGILLVWLYNLCYRGGIARFAFDYSSVAGPVFEDATKRGCAVALVGGEHGVAEAAAKVIQRRHPGLDFVATHPGFFGDSAQRDSALESTARADVVVVGMGAPAQEAFLADLWTRGWRGTGYTCGGFMDQIIGTDGTYFPAWSNRFHLRWLYRLCKEPRRLWKRYFVDYPVFVAVFLWDRLHMRSVRD